MVHILFGKTTSEAPSDTPRLKQICLSKRNCNIEVVLYGNVLPDGLAEKLGAIPGVNYIPPEKEFQTPRVRIAMEGKKRASGERVEAWLKEKLPLVADVLADAGIISSLRATSVKQLQLNLTNGREQHYTID